MPFGDDLKMLNYVSSAFSKYASFQGRARRSEFWYFILFNILFAVGCSVCAGIFSRIHFKALSIPFSFLNIGYFFVEIIPSISLQVRRAHDTGRSGWVMWVPIYNLVVLCTEGVDGENEYGPNPKAGEPRSDSPNLSHVA